MGKYYEFALIIFINKLFDIDYFDKNKLKYTYISVNMHIFCRLVQNVQKRILPQTAITVLTPQYLRMVGLPQVIPIGTGYTHACGCGSVRPIYPGKVRFGFIPEEWFEVLYCKTGVTGPYAFGVGLLNYLFSKEIYVCEHNFYAGLSFGILCILAVKKLGPKVADYADKQIEAFEKNWKQQDEEDLQPIQKMIDEEELEQWRAEGNLLLMQVKKENIALQVEAAYREALMKTYQDVKRCLDYEVQCRYTESRIGQKHMVQWLVENVTEQLPKTLDAQEHEKYRNIVRGMALNMQKV